MLEHYGLGVVLHPNVIVGHNVRLYHHVTVAGEMDLRSDERIVIGDRVIIGAHAIVVAPPHVGLSIGEDSIVGAGAIVTGDIPPRAVVAGNPARILRYRDQAEIDDPYAHSLNVAKRREMKHIDFTHEQDAR